MHYLASFERKAQERGMEKGMEKGQFKFFSFSAPATVWGITGMGGGAFAAGGSRGFGNGDTYVVSGRLEEVFGADDGLERKPH
ncbi:MAG: hypothetical protein IPL59_18735 [Candidatus Competibacteraceae bacterium]|nr:hypothetical protein [Candidatus Competibacteraceae bacterium]